jgi:predicted ATP-grasp superfamily ATP-dependent carboligase
VPPPIRRSNPAPWGAALGRVKDWKELSEGKSVQDPASLFTMNAQPDLERPVLVEALDGFLDAGSGRRLAREHLLNALDSEPVATFDVDQLYDYRGRRPEMTFTRDHWDGYAAPELAVHLVRDLNDVPFLLLHGPEPDGQWERFIAAVGILVAELDVRLVIGLNAVPMAVPHTRPPTVIAHGTPPELVADYPSRLPTVQVPASVGNLLEYRLGEAGTPACGFAVAVPYYLAQLDYPDAAHSLLDCVARAGELSLPTEALEHAAEVVRGQVDKQVAGSDEISTLVRGLEQQHDEMASGLGGELLADGARLPTADELGAEFEQYLSRRTDTDEDPTD